MTCPNFKDEENGLRCQKGYTQMTQEYAYKFCRTLEQKSCPVIKYIPEKELTFKDKDGRSVTYKCTHYQNFLRAKCPIDRTNLIQTIGEDAVSLACPACNIDYDSNDDPNEIRYDDWHLHNRIVRRHRDLQLNLARLEEEIKDIERKKQDYQKEKERLAPFVQHNPNCPPPKTHKNCFRK